MGKDTKISWAEHTFNPWWGCHDAPGSPGDMTELSPECANCYARTFDKRLGGSHWGWGAPRRFFGDAYWDKPIRWNAAAEAAGKRASVFCASMADWAEVHPDPDIRAQQNAARARLWPLIQRTPWLDWLLLSKRPQLWQFLLPWMPKAGGPQRDEPFANVWLGVTAGVVGAMWRVEILRATPAAKRFISGEPLLEHISADTWNACLRASEHEERPIDWLIIGDESGVRRPESGSGRRPAQLDWVRTAREAAQRYKVAFHFKQWNASGKTVHLPLLDGREWSQPPSSGSRRFSTALLSRIRSATCSPTC